ncbi:MAG: calcium-translocating P-type ATPase, PMCA-type [Clostridia bacterium]|nr:calcium-translocating P-type ATPase, PMCA-type [Clostridia bacterium]
MKEHYTKSIEEVLSSIKSTPQGLSTEEAEKRLAENGANQLEAGKKKTLAGRFFSQFKDVMIIVLILAAIISAVLAIVSKNYSDLVDAGIILFIVILNAIIGVAQEVKADNSLEALRNMNKPESKVYRDGALVKIDSEKLVVGDVVVLEAGDYVPADIRLLSSASLKIEEAALTGESVPIEKDYQAVVAEDAPLGDRKNLAYSTGIVSYGRGEGVVVATGMDTEVGKIAEMLRGDSQETPLQKQLDKTAKIVSVAVLAIAVIIFAVSLVRAYLINQTEFKHELFNCFMTAVAIAVAAIPEGLTAVVTIVLALGVQKMSKKNAIIRNLPAVETLGCCEVICSDKTGTLTLNKMTVKKVYCDGLFDADNAPDNKSVNVLLSILMLANDTNQTEEGLFGDPTETCLIAYGEERGIKYSAIKETWSRYDEIPFDSIRKLMTTYNRKGNEIIINVKGAPDELLARCSRILDNGEVRAITEEDKKKLLDVNASLADKALRVLGAAYKDGECDVETAESELIFVGLVGIIDPPRVEVKAAVAKCVGAGLRPVMITGDHARTAAAIAEEIGIKREGDKVMTGAEIDKLSDEEFAEHIREYAVFARVSPENKVRIVKAYQAQNCVVAMTGDGVNDAPAIKAADIGVGMGITGTDVSKGAADMVLADDNFVTIVGAVEEGRKIFSNITKAVQFLFSANIAEVLCLFLSTIVISSIEGINVEFLTPIMILWVNLVTDTLPALALGVEKAEPDIMSVPPRKREKSLFSGAVGRDIFIQGIMQTALCMTSYCLGYYVFKDAAVASTMVFVTLCFTQLFHAFNLRSSHKSIIRKDIFSNKLLDLALVLGAVLILGVALIPKVNTVFGAVDMDYREWLVALSCAFAIIPLVEVEKIFLRLMNKQK